MSALQIYTVEQVKQHDKKDDLWVIVHNKVYNITKYLEDHPGGTDVLVECAGTDATEAFEEIGHSDDAREALIPFHIGDLPSEEHAEAVEVYRPKFEHISQTTEIIPPKKRSSGLPARVLKAIIKLSLSGAIGAAAVTAYTQGWSTLLQRLSIHNLPHNFFHGISISKPGAGGSNFWIGFGIASTANITMALGLGLWASTKLDVQHEFTRHSPHRVQKADRIMPYPRGNKSKSASKKPPVLHPQQYRTFKLVQKVLVSPNVYRFVFALPDPSDVLGLPTGQHIALRATIEGKSVARSYTPVSNNKDLGRIELLVKVYPQGLMTNHLARMEVGDEIEIRGPKGAMQYSRSYAKHIGMIAGGTGITPMYQLIRAICEDEEDNTQISLLYANNSEEDILLRKELEEFAAKNPHKLKIQHVLAKPTGNWKGLKGFVNPEMIKEHLAPATDASKVLLCGPPPMINAMKKNLAGLGWKEPGAISKATDAVFLF